MKTLIFALMLLPFAGRSQDIVKVYQSSIGDIKAGDSVKIARPPFVHIYPKPGIDGGLRERWLYALEHKLVGKTLPIVRVQNIGTKKTRRAIAVLRSNSADRHTEVEFYVELEKALEANEVEIIKAK